MVEAAWVGALEFVDGKEELDVTVQLQNVFVKHGAVAPVVAV